MSIFTYEDGPTPSPDEIYKEGYRAGVWEAMHVVANEIQKLDAYINQCVEQGKKEEEHKTLQEKHTLEGIQHQLEIIHG